MSNSHLDDELEQVIEQLIKELEEQNKHARYNNDVYYEEMAAHKECRQERDELAAYVGNLRFRLMRLLDSVSSPAGARISDGSLSDSYWLAKNCYEQTPANSLVEHDNSVIEKCAEKCDFIAKVLGDIPAGRQSQHNAKAIRSLKGEGDE